MHGNTLTRSVRGVSYMLLRPQDGIRWAKGKLAPQSPIQMGLPWISWRAIDYLNHFIRPGLRVFEWGGGGSTIYWLRKGCHVTTVESNPQWFEAIRDAALKDGKSGQLDLRLIEAESRDPNLVVLVDGLEEDYTGRMDCLKELPNSNALKSGGIAVLDDSWRDQYQVAPGILAGWKRQALKSLGPCRPGVTQTDLYTAP